MSKKNISIIGTVGLPANYGGFETLAENLVNYLSGEYLLTVYCSSRNRGDRLAEYNGAELVYIPLQANGVQSTPYDIISIFRSIFKSDVLLVLGVSGCIIFPIVRLFKRKKIIAHIDGIEWRREKWGNLAKRFLKKSELYAVKYADIVIADNLAIQEYILSEYGKNSELIAYGGDHVISGDIGCENNWNVVFPRKGYAIKVCRIEPENNVHIVLEAFSKVESLPLLMIGNWSYSEYGRNLRLKYEKYSNIELLDPIYEKNKLNKLRSNAAVYIHGHSAGGTNPSLVEAMYLGLPIIAFGVNYNKETTKYAAKYFESEKELIEVLTNLKDLNLEAMGQKMKELALIHYNWKDISAKYAKLFDTV